MNKKIQVEKLEVISGVCQMQCATEHLSDLYESMQFAFLESSQMLILTGTICSVVYTKNDQYYLFDSHSHATDGLSCPDVGSLLVSFHCHRDLITFLYSMYNSMLIDTSSQFDLVPLHLFKISIEKHDTQGFVDL